MLWRSSQPKSAAKSAATGRAKSARLLGFLCGLADLGRFLRWHGRKRPKTPLRTWLRTCDLRTSSRGFRTSSARQVRNSATYMGGFADLPDSSSVKVGRL